MAYYDYNNMGMMQQPMFQPNQWQRQWQPQQPIQQQNIGFQQKPQQPMICGRQIEKPEEIVAAEVPNDGSIAYFPTRDFSMIYAKAWNADGNIDTCVYKRVETQQKTMADPDAEFRKNVMEQLDAISQMLSAKPSRKKEVQANE